jgi:hypothetical protein
VTELTDARRNAILNNLPTDLKNKIVWTYEWINYWKDRINKLQNDYIPPQTQTNILTEIAENVKKKNDCFTAE